MRESSVQKLVWAAASAISTLFRSVVRVTLWRVNTGTAWVGAGNAVRNPDGSVTLPAARPITLGFGMVNGRPVVGASDLCGLTSVVVTPQMVGRKIAIFTAIETKESGGGRTSGDQHHFIDFVKEAGGIAGVANTPAVAQAIVSDYCHECGVS